MSGERHQDSASAPALHPHNPYPYGHNVYGHNVSCSMPSWCGSIQALFLDSLSARRVGSGRRYPLEQSSTYCRLVSRLMRCPNEIIIGLTRVRVRTTAPMTSLPTFKGTHAPASSLNGS